MPNGGPRTEQASAMEHPFTGDPWGPCTVCLRPVGHWVHLVPPDPDAEPPEGPRTEQRHGATASAWAWLENGPGLLRPEPDQQRIKHQLEEMDAYLRRLDQEHYRAR